MKVLAMYLPQFHRVKENDDWWGDGFTDWVSARNAVPLFEGHYQPHIPKNNNYYDLSEKRTMEWQAELMHQYGVDGMCIYHYWFKDGRQILEKPVENLLEWNDIDMPYCFCWANETWARSWSSYKRGNVWSEFGETKISGNDDGILLEQNYGDEKAWKQHFDYLLPFFKDERYIKKDGKPLFVIYMSSEIYCLQEMIDCFNKLATENGLLGIYFICANSSKSFPENVCASLIHEPQETLRKFTIENIGNINNSVKKLDYDMCWDDILKCNISQGKTYYGGFVGYDDSPRRGVKGTVIDATTPEKFKKYLIQLIAKNKKFNNEFLFINAWNEWGEGMYLEPDEKWGYAYLESIIEAKQEYDKLDAEGYEFELVRQDADLERINSKVVKFENYLNTLDLWMELREKSISIEKYFTEHQYSKIAVYGYGIFSRHLIYELRGTSIEVVALIDKQRDKINCEVDLVLPGDEPEDIDVIVVTSFHFYNEIRSIYSDKNIKIVSIENIIKEAAGYLYES